MTESQLTHCLQSRSSVHHHSWAPRGPAAVATWTAVVKYHQQCEIKLAVVHLPLYFCMHTPTEQSNPRWSELWTLKDSWIFLVSANAVPFSTDPTWCKRQLGNWNLICRWWSTQPLPKSLNNEDQVTTAPQSMSDRYFTSTKMKRLDRETFLSPVCPKHWTNIEVLASTSEICPGSVSWQLVPNDMTTHKTGNKQIKYTQQRAIQGTMQARNTATLQFESSTTSQAWTFAAAAFATYINNK